MTRRREPATWIALGCVGLSAVVVVAVVVVIVVIVLRVSPSPTSAPGPSGPPTVPLCKGPVPTETRAEQRVAFADPTRVDPVEAWPVIQALAARIGPDAKLLGISASDVTPAIGGKYDLTKGFLVVNLDYQCNVPGAPPGADLRDGMIHVVITAGSVHAQRMGPVLQPMSVPRLHAPPCPASAAFAAAVAAGVPANAVARMVYTGGTIDGSRQAIWIVTVDGHPELRREVDGETCARVVMNGKVLPVVVPPPGPPPAPATLLSP